jgi:hypothetical protein
MPNVEEYKTKASNPSIQPTILYYWQATPTNSVNIYIFLFKTRLAQLSNTLASFVMLL